MYTSYALSDLSTPPSLLDSLLGGCLIGLAAGLYLWFTGQRAGLSGIYSCKWLGPSNLSTTSYP